jgi:hypothetical protein
MLLTAYKVLPYFRRNMNPTSVTLFCSTGYNIKHLLHLESMCLPAILLFTLSSFLVSEH